MISEAFYSITLICVFLKLLFRSLRKTPSQETGRFRLTSLTMTYFHTGTRTIIGAEAFHCPVRDGKEWYHFAMVVRHNCLSSWFGFNRSRQPIYRANQLHRFNEPTSNCLLAGFLNASTWHNFLDQFKHLTMLDQSYRVKPHEQLVSVSLTHYCASTPDLSTSWSWTTL